MGTNSALSQQNLQMCTGHPSWHWLSRSGKGAFNRKTVAECEAAPLIRIVARLDVVAAAGACDDTLPVKKALRPALLHAAP